MQRDYIELDDNAGTQRVKLTQPIATIGHKNITDSNLPPPLTASSATLTPALSPCCWFYVPANPPLITFTYLLRYISRNAPQARPQRDQDHLPPSYRWWGRSFFCFGTKDRSSWFGKSQSTSRAERDEGFRKV